MVIQRFASATESEYKRPKLLHFHRSLMIREGRKLAELHPCQPQQQRSFVNSMTVHSMAGLLFLMPIKLLLILIQRRSRLLRFINARTPNY